MPIPLQQQSTKHNQQSTINNQLESKMDFELEPTQMTSVANATNELKKSHLGISETFITMFEKLCTEAIRASIDQLAEVYKFDRDEAYAKVGLSRMKAEVKTKEPGTKKPRATKATKIALPFSKSKVNPKCCKAIANSLKLYTQCVKTPEEGSEFCKGCNEKGCIYGTVNERYDEQTEILNRKSNKNEKIKPYLKYLEDTDELHDSIHQIGIKEFRNENCLSSDKYDIHFANIADYEFVSAEERELRKKAKAAIKAKKDAEKAAKAAKVTEETIVKREAVLKMRKQKEKEELAQQMKELKAQEKQEKVQQKSDDDDSFEMEEEEKKAEKWTLAKLKKTFGNESSAKCMVIIDYNPAMPANTQAGKSTNFRFKNGKLESRVNGQVVDNIELIEVWPNHEFKGITYEYYPVFKLVEDEDEDEDEVEEEDV